MSIDEGSGEADGAAPDKKVEKSARESLLDDLRGAQTWFALAEPLAIFAQKCGADRPAFVTNGEEVLWPEDLSVRAKANKIVAPPPPEGPGGSPVPQWEGPPPPEVVAEIREYLLAEPNDGALAAVALEFAQAIGQHRHSGFALDYFDFGAPRMLEFGRAYAQMARSPLAAIGRGISFNTDPAKLPPAFGQVKGLRLAGEAARWFTIQVTSWIGNGDPLAALGDHRPLVVATCHPNFALEEFDAPYSVDVAKKQASFHTVGPINQRRQKWLLRRQLADAVGAGATVVVIPEYAVHADDRKSLRTYINGFGTKKPLLVLAGTSRVLDPMRSAHADAATDDDRANQAIVWAGGEQWTQEKLFPAKITSPVPHLPKAVPGTEMVTPGQMIRIFRTERWVVAVLICRDAMQHQIMHELAELGVNLCLVASSSPHSGSIVGSLASLRTRSQAFTVLANAPASWDGAPPALDAAFDGPFEHPPGPLVKLSSDREAGPGIWVWRPTPESREAQWHPTVVANGSPAEWLREFTRLVNGPRYGEDVRQSLAHLLAMHWFPATWRRKDGDLATGEAAEAALGSWLAQPPTVDPTDTSVKVHGLVAILRFTWVAALGLRYTWTTVLVQQPDEHWLCLFHDPYGPPHGIPSPAPNELRTAAKAWEEEFVRLANRPGADKRARSAGQAAVEIVDKTWKELRLLYADEPVYMPRPGRASVGEAALERLMREALLVRGPRFRLDPGEAYAYGQVVVQTCQWRLTDMGEGFPDESGRSTVVLLAEPDGAAVRCIYDDPWSKLSGPLQLE